MAADHPLPADLVVRELRIPKAGEDDSWPAFIVAVHPALDGATAHRTMNSALLLARALAAQRGAGSRVWRELPGREGAYGSPVT